MDYSQIINEFKQASVFDLYRMSVAIKNEMESHHRIAEIQRMLVVGQDISYFDRTNNTLRPAKLLQKNQKYAVVLDLQTNTNWKIPYYLLNLQNVDTKIQTPHNKLDKNSLSVGDTAGFDYEGRKIIGKIVRLNFKTATLMTNDNKQWRVAYPLLFSVMDVDQSPAYIEISHSEI